MCKFRVIYRCMLVFQKMNLHNKINNENYMNICSTYLGF